MNINFKGSVKDYLDNLSSEKENKIRKSLKELSKQNLDHKNVKLIKFNNRFLFRLKIGGRGQELNHRAIFDIDEGDIEVLALGHRDQIYDN